MKRILILISGAAILTGVAVGQSDVAAAAKTAFLEQEYALAKTSASYFVFDFNARVIVLKARGFVLKSWSIAAVRKWGRPTAMTAYPLTKKSAINKPQRKNITPKPGEPPKDAELDVLELEKMPLQYALELPDEIRLHIRPQTKGFKRFFGGIGRIFSWTIAQPVKTVFRAVKKSPFTDIDIVVPTEKEAKGIYWSFFEGQKCLLHWPE
jgi:hypothetical protein